MSNAYEIDGHRLALLQNGSEYFPRLIAAIESARHSIYLETYIFAADETGRLLKACLENAARRSVSVHVLLDGYGSADFPLEWLEQMRTHGVKVLWFRPELARLSFRRQRLRRLHRKLALVDEHTAFIGGINIINDIPPQMQAPRLDYAVEVQGAVVTHIAYSMRKLWRLVSWTNFRRVDRHVGRAPEPLPEQKISFLIRDNLRHRREIEHAYLWALSHAREEIIIANAYFLPGHRFRHFLTKAAHRGVRVVLLLQGRVEYRVQHYATLAMYEELLQAGVEIHEYSRSFLHAKVAVVDGSWATVGSSNIDPFSLWLAREANLVVHDAGFAGQLRSRLLQEMQSGGRQVLPEDWKRRGLWSRLVMRVSYSLIRLLADMVGYANKLDDI